jgi:hypothetical protein
LKVLGPTLGWHSGHYEATLCAFGGHGVWSARIRKNVSKRRFAKPLVFDLRETSSLASAPTEYRVAVSASRETLRSSPSNCLRVNRAGGTSSLNMETQYIGLATLVLIGVPFIWAQAVRLVVLSWIS